MRPCQNAHPLSPDSCRLCAWCLDPSEKGRAYRARWGEPEPPTLMEKAVSFAGAAAWHWALGMPAATGEERARRLSACAACPEAVTKGGVPDSCRKCGCNLGLKASWRDQACPLGRWDSVGSKGGTDG